MDYDRIIEEMERTIIEHIRIGQKQNLMGIGSHKKISNSFKGGGVQPLKVFEIPNSNGILTTDENKIDKLAREVWEKNCKGNIQDEDKMISNFTEKYKNHIFKNEEGKIEPLDWKDVKTHAQTPNQQEVQTSGLKRTPHDI